ncbi:MAG TPA: twin-arginine translocase TatA/TatE family subunit [Acidimicrobiales bacterium]|jgi:sec-independent protein translocase protein TatB|nr:twin-arginine translocase TatA/TatE family subunit [Acidimicrobiales bacterium]
MFNLDPGKLLIIGVVAVLLLGPDRLPQVARQLGGAWRSFNDFRHRMESEVRSSIPDMPSSTDIARLARSPSALLDHLSSMGTDSQGNASTAEAPDGSPLIAAAPVAPLPATPAPSPRPTEVVQPGDPSLN